MFYKMENAFNMIARLQEYKQCNLMRSTEFEQKTQRGTFNLKGAKCKNRIMLPVT